MKGSFTFQIMLLASILLVTASFANGQRIVRVGAASGVPGGQVIVPIELESQGNEFAGQFTLNFDPLAMSISSVSPSGNPDVMLGTGTQPGTSLAVNGLQAPLGRIGIIFDSLNPFQSSPPARQVATFRFSIAASAALGCTPVTFGNVPVPRAWSDGNGSLLPAVYVDGCVDVLPDSDGDGVGDGVDSCPSSPNPGQEDIDGDGLGDVCDAVPNSDVSPSTLVGGCDSGVSNQLQSNGASFNDSINQIIASARNRGQMVSGLTHLINGWRNAGLITNRQRNAIHGCL